MVAPLVKWPGGKTRELPAILAALPDDAGRLVDPFVGGGALLFALPPQLPAVVNDASVDLVDLYRRTAAQDPATLGPARDLAAWWDVLGEVVAAQGDGVVGAFAASPTRSPAEVADASRGPVEALVAPVVDTVPASWTSVADALVHDLRRLVPAKLARMRAGEWRRRTPLPGDDLAANVEGAVRAAVYTRLRDDYNAARAAGRRDGHQAVRFLFLREYAYAAMFRFNRRGEFNVPYGGISYNRKALADRVGHLGSAGVRDRLATTDLACEDFEVFLAGVDLRPDDVVFLDPPYDSDFSSYDRRGFGPDDHARLARVVRDLPCRFQMVVKDTPLVRRLHVDDRFEVASFDLTYAWTIKSRNDRRATHLLITG